MERVIDYARKPERRPVRHQIGKALGVVALVSGSFGLFGLVRVLKWCGVDTFDAIANAGVLYFGTGAAVGFVGALFPGHRVLAISGMVVHLASGYLWIVAVASANC